MRFSGRILFVCVLVQINVFAAGAQSQSAASSSSEKPQLVLLDTDIGDDIDDAFALSLLLQSPEVRLLGITTAYGDTELRARLLDRYLKAVGRTDIPVAAGIQSAQTNGFTQAAYARTQPDRKYPAGVAFMLSQIRQHPGEITLIAIGPLVNVGAVIQQDPATFHKLKRVVIMGGSVHRGYGPVGTPPAVEWNTKNDPAAMRTLLGSGVPVFIMPLDSTQVHLDENGQDRLFSYGSSVTDQLAILYHQWKTLSGWHPTGPNLFDPVAVTYALKPEICPMQPIRLSVDNEGMTIPEDGEPNAQVCLKLDEGSFLNFLLNRLAPALASKTP